MDAPYEATMFVLRHVVVPLFFPAAVSIELLFGALVLLWFSRKQRAGKVAATMAAAILTVSFYTVVSDALLRPLEDRYPPLTSVAGVDSPDSSQRPIKWVVVLSASQTANSAGVQLSPEALVRLVEGIRIYRALQNSKLLLSGGSSDVGSTPDAVAMGNVAEHVLGVDAADIVLESQSLNTADEAMLVRSIVRADRFVLVTSASHMPRSMALFEKFGMEPIPAPTYYLTRKSPLVIGDLYPRPNGLANVQRAAYEYLGLLWVTLKRQI